ncbi:hypothetical protein BDR06DRAFT_973375 [Suillus hirtellus]|nr:hypothetical protein BDR06DRAFT_973375 [Suillus hirtellus]
MPGSSHEFVWGVAAQDSHDMGSVCPIGSGSATFLLSNSNNNSAKSISNRNSVKSIRIVTSAGYKSWPSSYSILPSSKISFKKSPQKIPHHLAQKMRCSLLAVVVVLTASMFVNACSGEAEPCETNAECCNYNCADDGPERHVATSLLVATSELESERLSKRAINAVDVILGSRTKMERIA